MTYDEYEKQQSGYVPPPMPAPMPTVSPRPDLLRDYAKRVGGSRLLSNYSDAIGPRPPAYSMGGMGLGGYGDWLKPNVSLSSIINPLDFGRRPTTNPSFEPMRGEKLALQIPGLGPVLERFSRSVEPPDFRSMPRSGPAPEQTPYPRPPFMTFKHWMDTGERGPLPLDSFREGRRPTSDWYGPNTPMPEAYEARTSGGLLADAGRAAMRGVAGQPLAQTGNIIPNNAMMYASTAKTPEERTRENTRAGLEEYRLAALEPLMMRKYAEKMGYIPTPGTWKRIWRAIVENYTQNEGGLTRGGRTPAPE